MVRCREVSCGGKGSERSERCSRADRELVGYVREQQHSGARAHACNGGKLCAFSLRLWCCGEGGDARVESSDMR